MAQLFGCFPLNDVVAAGTLKGILKLGGPFGLADYQIGPVAPDNTWAANQGPEQAGDDNANTIYRHSGGVGGGFVFETTRPVMVNRVRLRSNTVNPEFIPLRYWLFGTSNDTIDFSTLQPGDIIEYEHFEDRLAGDNVGFSTISTVSVNELLN